MGLPMEKGAAEQLENERRESQGTVTGEAKLEGQGHARDVPVVKAAKKGKSLFSRFTGVAP